MNLIASTSTFGFFTLISRILGYVRDILIAIFLGTGLFADAFFVAFRLPNTFRRLFAEGTFNAAFIPSYAGALAKDKIDADNFAKKNKIRIINLLKIDVEGSEYNLLKGAKKTLKKNKKWSNKYYSIDHGTNSRLDEVQASILNLKLKYVNSFIRKRRLIAQKYFQGLKELILKCQL